MVNSEPQRALVLHSRNYTDSRIIVELLTEIRGRVSTVFRLPSSRRGAARPQPFMPYLINYSGKSSLKTLTLVESAGPVYTLVGVALYCGMYLNELILRLLVSEDECPEIFDAYEKCLDQLVHIPKGEEDIPLRQFELLLLSALGYGIDFASDVSGDDISSKIERYYRFDPEAGFIPEAQDKQADGLYQGTVLALVHQGQWQSDQCRLVAKRVCRVAIGRLLGDKPLASRELFVKS